MTSNLHWDGYSKAHKSSGTKFSRPGITESWHTFGLLWLPTEYVFYVDGQETWRSSVVGVSQVPEYVKLTEEIGTWADHRVNAPQALHPEWVPEPLPAWLGSSLGLG